MSRNTAIILAVGVGVLVLFCCCCMLVFAAGGALYYTSSRTIPFPPSTSSFTFDFDTATPQPNINKTPAPTPRPGEPDTLAAIAEAVIPTRDLRDLAEELTGQSNLPETIGGQNNDYALGTVLNFNANNTDSNSNFTLDARLVYKTENVYFFAEENLSVDQGDVRRSVDDFQNRSYPTNREFFGPEWEPGVDDDPHLYILYARGIGSSVAGYYSSNDEYPVAAFATSNQKEMFYINADNTSPGDSSVGGTLAHEFQHMIHWRADSNEETWLNEGASVLAETLNGYGTDGFDDSFLESPNLQLNAWGESGGGDNIPHYGAAFLYLTYFLDRFGEDAMKALVRHPANGLPSVDAILQEQNLTDLTSGEPLTAKDVFADWVIANYLNDGAVEDGRYGYIRYQPNTVRPTESFSNCPVSQTDSVRQFAAKYYEFECIGTLTLNFSGSQQVNVVPTDAHSGSYAFWGHRNDESNTTLQREFDLSSVSGAMLSYWAWWEIEDDYDYAYVQASADGGQTWQVLRANSSIDTNPSGQNYGWGYTGSSGGGSDGRWVEESVSLDEYAGQTILIRFQYITDPAVNRPGLLVDDITVDALDYSEDFENGDGGWLAEGFVRHNNRLPQTFMVQVIIEGSAPTNVERVPLDATNSGALTLTLQRGERAIVVVSGSTYFTTESASYEFELK